MMRCFILLCIVVLSVLVVVEGTKMCAPCKWRGRLPCPRLPKSCEPGMKPCGCCPVCKGKIGDSCGWFSPPCESGLRCSKKGKWKWFGWRSGTCKSRA